MTVDISSPEIDEGRERDTMRYEGFFVMQVIWDRGK